MHRLSLANSPSRNSLFRGGNEEETVESRRGEGESRGEIEEAKRERLRRICRKERLVHLIPFVLLFCILVLYIFSFDPTQKGTRRSVTRSDLNATEGSGIIQCSTATAASIKPRGTLPPPLRRPLLPYITTGNRKLADS